MASIYVFKYGFVKLFFNFFCLSVCALEERYVMKKKKPFLKVIAKFDYKLRVICDCVIMSRVNHPCCFSGCGGGVVKKCHLMDQKRR